MRRRREESGGSERVAEGRPARRERAEGGEVASLLLSSLLSEERGRERLAFARVGENHT